jgi:undecaprenyl-diphosphatase
MIVFVVVAVLVVTEPAWFVDVDQQISRALESTATTAPWVATLAQVVTQLGSGWVAMGLVLVVGGALLATKNTVLAVWLAASVGGSALLNGAVKEAVQRDRPDYPGTVVDPLGSSFPSGHSQSVVVTWVSVLLVVGWMTVLVSRAARISSVVLVGAMVAAVGWSRVALGVHWPSDVLGGWSLGSAWVLAATAVLLGVPSPPPAEP